MTTLPSLQSLDCAQSARIWLAAEAADMRCGFDRLAERVRTVIGQDPLGGHLFVFRSRRGDRLKVLVWDRDGFVLCEFSVGVRNSEKIALRCPVMPVADGLLG